MKSKRKEEAESTVEAESSPYRPPTQISADSFNKKNTTSFGEGKAKKGFFQFFPLALVDFPGPVTVTTSNLFAGNLHGDDFKDIIDSQPFPSFVRLHDERL